MLIALVCLMITGCQTANSLYPEGYKEQSIGEFNAKLPVMLNACLSNFDKRQAYFREMETGGFTKSVRTFKGNEYVSFSTNDKQQVEIRGKNEPRFLSHLSLSFLNKKSSFTGCSIRYISHREAVESASGEILNGVSNLGYKFTDIKTDKKITIFSYQKKKTGIALFKDTKRFKQRSMIQYTILKLPFELPEITPKKPSVNIAKEKISSLPDTSGTAARSENARIASQQANQQRQQVQQRQQQFINNARARNPAPPTGLN